MSGKVDYMLDKMNTPSIPKWLDEIMADAGVKPVKASSISCRNCGKGLDDDNVYGQCPNCYFKELNE